MSDLLIQINHVTEALRDSYVLYNMAGGTYYILHRNYALFMRHHCRYAVNGIRKHLTMDLGFAKEHALVFDFDGTASQEEYDAYMENVVIPILKNNFLVLGNLTAIQANRWDGGMHVHLPEMMITHDDYVLFCTKLQPLFKTEKIRLDIPMNWTLSKSSKVDTPSYEPRRIYYLEELKDLMLEFKFLIQKDGSRGYQLNDFKKIQGIFKRKKDNSKSFFRKILYQTHADVLAHVYEYTMPIVQLPVYKISYPTLITKDDEPGFEKVAHFWDRERNLMYIHKGEELRMNGYHWLRSYYFLQYNAFTLTGFVTSNHALQRWYSSCSEQYGVIQDVFESINVALKQDQYAFIENPNPLQTVLEYDDCYYFLPVFFALVKVLNMSSRHLVYQLRNIVGCQSLLDKLEEIDPKVIAQVSEGLSLDTILYCGSNVGDRSERMKDRIANIIHSMKAVIITACTNEQIVEHIRRIQERHFPIMMVSMTNSCKKPVRYMWNPMNHSWQETFSEKDVTNIISTIYLYMQAIIKVDKQCNEIIHKVKLPLIVSSILSESSNERKVVQMDRHKWFIRTRCGVMDLLTGHVGATVPEFFISDRQLGVNFSRTQFRFIREDPDILKLYKLLTDEKFYRKFLINLYDNVTDDIGDTLRETVWMEIPNMHEPLHDSMINAFAHLCKYMSFEYERYMYVMDVLSSLLVSTNYARKFFILKGVTRNGKSKFFQLIGRVFGNYSHTIRNVNFQPSSGCTQVPQPELATTMFKCRVVSVEELCGKLDENLVKVMTGNSTTSFRNLFEQNTGGIPSAKIFASANTIPICTSTVAFKDRVVVFPCESTFTNEAQDLPTSEQVRLDEYPLDTGDSLIEDCYEGLFILLSRHLELNMDKQEGTINYRREPDSMLEYKEEFLTPTDIYTQFKMYADVQVAAGNCTTLSDLKSTIRLFLKYIKNPSIEETEIVLKFDAQFGHMRRSEPEFVHSFLSDSFSNADDKPLSFSNASLNDDKPLSFKRALEDEEQKLAKKLKLEPTKKRPSSQDDAPAKKSLKLDLNAPQRMMVYYDNVTIKNLKKEKKY